MSWARFAGGAGTWLLCMGAAWLIWHPFERKWPRIAVGFFSAGMVLLFDTGFGQWVRSLIEWVLGLLTHMLAWFHVNGHSVLVITSASLISLASLVALGYLIAHLLPRSVSGQDVSEVTFIAAAVVIALASIIPGPIGGGISSVFAGFANVISWPLAAAFGA